MLSVFHLLHLPIVLFAQLNLNWYRSTQYGFEPSCQNISLVANCGKFLSLRTCRKEEGEEDVSDDVDAGNL